MSKENIKREKFTQPEKKSKGPLIGATVALGVVLLMGGLYLGSENSAVDSKATASVGKTVNYSPKESIQQVKLPPAKVANGKVSVISLSELKDKKFIWTEYKDDGKRVPLTALVKPDGKVVVAVSVCEPCRSELFHISGNTIVCNACGTTWDLQSFKGLSGGCQDYPPDLLAYSQNGDNLEVDQSALNAWRPRI